MNKYEEKMTSVVRDFSGGIWFKNEDVKVGYSFAETIFNYGVDGDVFVISEYDGILSTLLYDNWEDLFAQNPDVEFAITRDCAHNGNFVTWQQFKDALDDKSRVNIVSF